MPRPTFHNLPVDKRQRVIDAAVAEFATHPFRVASLDRIAAAAGVSKGSLYQYFEDKGDLYRWLLGDWLPRRKQAAMQQALDADASLFDILEGSFHAGLRLFVEEPALARLSAVLLDAIPDPEIGDLHHQGRERSHAALVAMVQQAQARGDVRPDLDPILAAVWIEHVMGRGLLDALARRMGLRLGELVQDTARVRSLPAEELDAVVSGFSAMLRAALGS